MKIIAFILFLTSFNAFSQHSSDVFFFDFTSAVTLDTLSTAMLNKTVKKNMSTFNQPMFTYGSDDPDEWALLSEYILKYADICLPSARMTDINNDGFQDLLISMMRGSEYTEVGIYLGSKKGYRNVLFEPAWFHGTFENGDLLLRVPACCDDPTNEFHRISISEEGMVTQLDSLSIATNIDPDGFTHEQLFVENAWDETRETLFAIRLENPHEAYGAYEPGAEIRVIQKKEIDGELLMFCEIRGTLTTDLEYNHVYPHAFAWLSTMER